MNRNIPIRKLYMAPIKPNISGQIEGYFRKFGEVEKVEIHEHRHYHYAFVQFKSVDCAKFVLSQNWHRIGNCRFAVNKADIWHQPDYNEPPHPLLKAPARNSKLHILIALNDDCMLAIFRFLNIRDLAIAADVCKRFKRHAIEVFQNKFAPKMIDITTADFSETEIFFRNFGGLLQSLSVTASEPIQIFQWNLINEYCSPDLKKLSLSDFRVSIYDNEIAPMKSFAQLEYLQLIYCDVGVTLDNVLKMCCELRELHIRAEYSPDSYFINLSHTFPKLERAEFSCNGDTYEFLAFIELNPTLTYLRLFLETLDWSVLLPVVARHLPNLQTFMILGTEDVIFPENICLMANLRELRKLEFDFNFRAVNPLVRVLAANYIPIEELELNSGKLCTNAYYNICQLKSIKALVLVSCDAPLTEDQFIELAKELPLLESIWVRYFTTDEKRWEISTIGLKKMLQFAENVSLLSTFCVDNTVIDVDDYKAMLNIVSNRPTKRKLAIDLCGRNCVLDVPEEMLAQNKDVLDITFQDHCLLGS